jgi:hypothetical protein
MPYKIIETKEQPGVYGLFENGIAKHCPFKVPLVLQGKVSGGQPQIVYHPCRSDCALFETEPGRNNQVVVFLKCSQKAHFIAAEKASEEAKVKPLIN